MTYRKAEEHLAKGRQGHAAIALDRFNMFIIGGTTDTSLVDPTPINPEEAVWTFDLEASTWLPKSRFAPPQTSDVMPWNMVFHSVFKLDSQNLGVLWYDIVKED